MFEIAWKKAWKNILQTNIDQLKKENIGLIEVMGLAVLPARLANEISALQSAIFNGESLEDNPHTASHAAWAKEVIAKHTELSKENAREILEQEIGQIFLNVLCDAGVFKRDEKGQRAFDRFISAL